MQKSFFQKGKVAIIAALTIIASTATYFLDLDTFFYKTNVLEFPEHAPFNGTLVPIEKVPNWVGLDSKKWNNSYGTLSDSELIELPEYNPDVLKTSTDSLKWGNVSDNKVRNAKITYSVPYMGSYLLDGVENGGSHLAVDIKIPEGTPIYAIGNGTVIKSSTQSSGFGHHIVLMHNNFPSFDNPNVLTVYYSSYSHLSDVLVDTGDVVQKGQQIASSGLTGTATTPHLHFQIDNDDAPWHPYWPFTWKEAQDAGYNFFEAVNEGLGRDDAILTTINPMKYVQKYADGEYVVPENSGAVTDSYVDNEDSEDVEDPVVDEPVEPEVSVEPELNFKFNVKDKYYIGHDSDFTIFAKDQFGKPYTFGFEGDLTVASATGSITADKSIVNSFQFDSDGKIDNFFERMNPGRDRVKIEYNGETFYSDWFEIEEKLEEPLFQDIAYENKYFDAVNHLANKKIINGYEDGTFKPLKTVNRVEALKFILEGIDAEFDSGELPFSDTDKSEWYGKYLFTGYKLGVVNGDPDGSFRPEDSVNRAEFFKILFNGMGVDIDPNVSEPPYEDVPIDAWFAPYIAYAKDLGIIDADLDKIEPSSLMKRGEVADAMYKLMQIME